MNGYNNAFDNTKTLQEFFKKQNYELEKRKPSDVLDNVKINQWVNALCNADPDKDRSKLKNIIRTYSDKEHVIAPYLTDKGEIITLYIDQPERYGAGAQNHASTGMIKYGNDWYVSLDVKDNRMNSQFVMWLKKVTPENFDEIAKSKGWVKLQ